MVGTDTGASKSLPWDVVAGKNLPTSPCPTRWRSIRDLLRGAGGRADRRSRGDHRYAGDGQGRDARDPLLHDAALHIQQPRPGAQPGLCGAGSGELHARAGRARQQCGGGAQVAADPAAGCRGAHPAGIPQAQPRLLAVRDRRRIGPDRRRGAGHHRRHRRGVADALCQHQGAHQRVRHLARARCVRRLHPQGDPVAGRAERPHGLCAWAWCWPRS